jgi:putative ATP-dependent DNA ligase
MRFVADALNLTPPAAKRLEERNILRSAFIKHPFFPDIVEALKLEKKFGEFEEGTLIVKTNHGLEIVRGYPKIRRALTLYPTLKRHFKGDVVIEEKMNGYNVRIVLFGNNLYAITRRGFICPYTTEKARELINESFFSDNPSLMLCCEAVGMESPYVMKDVYDVKGLDFFVFDVRDRRTNIPLPVEKKIKLSEEYDFKIAPVLKKCSVEKAHIECRNVIEELGEGGREGVVIKDPEMVTSPVKYTASQSNTSDLSYAFRYFNDYGKDFMLSRIVREAFQSFEFGESVEELEKRCERLGRAILKSMVESIENVANGRKVTEKHRLRFRSEGVMYLFMQQIRKMGVEVIFHEPKFEKGYHVLEFERVLVSTTDKIRHHLEGNLW